MIVVSKRSARVLAHHSISLCVSQLAQREVFRSSSHTLHHVAATSVVTQYGPSPGANSTTLPAGPRLIRTKPGCGCRFARRSARRSCTRRTPKRRQASASPRGRSVAADGAGAPPALAAPWRPGACGWCRQTRSWRWQPRALASAAPLFAAARAPWPPRAATPHLARRLAAAGRVRRESAASRGSRQSATHAPCAC